MDTIECADGSFSVDLQRRMLAQIGRGGRAYRFAFGSLDRQFSLQAKIDSVLKIFGAK